MNRKELGRREALRALVFLGMVAASGCQVKREATEDTEEAEEVPIPGVTAQVVEVVPPAEVTTTPSPVVPELTVTPVPTEVEVAVSVEEMARDFEKELWRSGGTAATRFLAQPIRKVSGEWEIDPNKEVEELYYSGVNFRVEQIVGQPMEDGSIEFFGFVSGVTGDSRIYTVSIARYFDGNWEFYAQPVEQMDEPDREIIANYLYMVGDSHFNLYKGRNVAQSARLTILDMMQHPIEKRGGIYSMLGSLNASDNFFNPELYRPGWALGIDEPVPAGGACGGATPLARMFAQARGYGRIIEGTPHSEAVYPDLPYGGEEDEVDVTVFYSEEIKLDLKWVNDSDQDLWVIPKISFMAYGEYPKWWSALWSPSPVKMMMSWSLSTTPPTEEDLRLIEEQIAWMDNFIETRPTPGEASGEDTAEVEGEPFFDIEKVDAAYVLEGGQQDIMDIRVDSRIMAAVRSLNIEVSGDCTARLLKALPVDNAPDAGDSMLIHYSSEFRPAWEMKLMEEGDIILAEEAEGQYLASEAMESLHQLQHAALALGMESYVGYGFRDDELQWLINQVNPAGSAGIGSSEHVTGLSADLFSNRNKTRVPGYQFANLANQHGWVNSLTRAYDPAHYFYLDAIWPGLTKALLDAGLDPNNRPVSAQARMAVFQIIRAQAVGR